MRSTRCARFFLAMLTGFTSLHISSTAAQLVDRRPVNDVRKQAGTDSLHVQQLMRRSDFFYDTNLDSSLYYAERSVDLAKAHLSNQLLAKTYAKLGHVLFNRSEFSKSLTAFQRVEQLSRSRLPDSTLLKARIFTAMLYRTGGNYSEGLRLALAALKMYEKRPAHYGREVAYLFTELGVIYDDLRNTRMALAYHQRRLRFSEQGDHKREQCIALSNLGYFYLRNGQYKQAHDYTHRALEGAYKLNSQLAIADALGSLGTIAFRQHLYRQAALYHQDNVRMTASIGANEPLGVGLTQLAQDYEAMGNYAKAEQQIRRSVHILKNIQSVYHLRAALLVQSRVLERLDRLRESLTVARQAYVLSDSMIGIDKQKTIAQLQARYDLSQKQQQLATLNKNFLIQQQATRAVNLELSLTRQQRLLYLISALLLSLLLSMGYISYRKQERTGILLVQQKDELAQRAGQLTELNKTKDKLFSLISHDLRAPVSRLKYSLLDLQNANQSTPDLQLSLAQLDSQVDHIMALLTNLLDWSFLQMRGFQANMQPVDLFDVIDDTIGQMEMHLQQKKICLINHVTRQTLVQADKHYLACIVRNTLSNAIKFTPDEGYIRLHVVREEGKTQLIIQDTGIGMSANQLDRLMTDPQIRTGTRGEPSTGLGMRLCTELITHLSGTLHITSQPNEGATVQVNLQTVNSPQPVCWPV